MSYCFVARKIRDTKDGAISVTCIKPKESMSDMIL